MQENLAGIRVVKAFVRRHHERTRFEAANADLVDQAILAARTVAVMRPFVMLTLNLGVIGVLWFGGIQVSQGAMQVGRSSPSSTICCAPYFRCSWSACW
ncbi:MAG: ABC transporter transmembrane domain-containing protein [Chloroflexota bacterium]|nr:ABC transporter transmembrane domain-containing protein [Chloroflexota bacterium]